MFAKKDREKDKPVSYAGREGLHDDARCLFHMVRFSAFGSRLYVRLHTLESCWRKNSTQEANVNSKIAKVTKYREQGLQRPSLAFLEEAQEVAFNNHVSGQVAGVFEGTAYVTSWT